MKHIKYIFLSVVALAMASCGKEMTTDELMQKLPAPEVKLSTSYGYGSELRVGRTKNIYISWNFDSYNFNWRTSNNNVAIVSKAGSSSTHEIIIKGISQGKSIVTAEIDGLEASVEVEVLPLADFNVRQTLGTKKMTYTFIASYYEFYRADWTFGDGSTYSQYSDSKYTGVNTTYASSGTYNVTLSLYDRNYKLIDSYTKTVTVE